MASSGFTQDVGSKERCRKIVNAKVAIGATGAATLDAANSKGVLSVTRGGSVGLYTIVFGTTAQLDAYVKFLGMEVTVQNSTGVPLTPGYGLKTNNIADPTAASIVFQLLNAAGAAAEAASGDTLFLQFEFSDGS